MQKMKRELFDKIIQSNISKHEIRFLFYLAMRCDKYGEVKGAYYSEVSAEIDCSVANFYEIREHLTKKGFITWEKSNSADMDVTLIGNSFMNAQGQEEYTNYIDINIAVFHDKSFFRLKAGAIRTAMELIKRVALQKGIETTNSLSWNKRDAGKRRKLFYRLNEFQEEISEKLNVSCLMIKKYLYSLNKWISVYGVKNSYVVLTVDKSALLYKNIKYLQKGGRSEKEERKKMEQIKVSYCLDKDLFKALKIQTIQEEINLTDAINKALRTGLKEYL